MIKLKDFWIKIGAIFIGILAGILFYALIYEIVGGLLGGQESESFHGFFSKFPYAKPSLWILGFFIGSIITGYIGKKNGVLLGFFVALPLAIFTLLVFLQSLSKGDIDSMAGGYSTITFLFMGVIIFCIIGGKLGEICRHNLIFKGAIGGLCGYLATVTIASVVLSLLNLINKTVGSAYLTTIGIILLIGYSGFLGAVIAIITNKPTTNWAIFYLVLTLIPFSIIAIVTNEAISFMFLIIFVGGYLGYLKDKSRKIRFFLLFALPSFGRVPRFKRGDLLDTEAREASEMAMLPSVPITSSLILGLVFGIIDNFKNSLWSAIAGSIFGLLLGFIYLMIIGNVIRKFIGLSLTLNDLSAHNQ